MLEISIRCFIFSSVCLNISLNSVACNVRELRRYAYRKRKNSVCTTISVGRLQVAKKAWAIMKVAVASFTYRALNIGLRGVDSCLMPAPVCKEHVLGVRGPLARVADVVLRGVHVVLAAIVPEACLW